MSLVEIATLAWGVVEDQAGNVRPDLPVSLSFASDGSTATVLDGVGGSPIAALQTNSNGEIPGFVQQGSYVVSVGGVTHNVEAISATLPSSGSANEPGTSVCVGTTSQIILPSNPSRIKLILSNLDADNAVYVSYGQDAVVGSGITLYPFGPPYVEDAFTGIVYAIAVDTNTCIGITEI